METDTYPHDLLDVVRPEPLRGELQGRCIICLRACSTANPLGIVSENFTNWQDLNRGDSFCCRCSAMLKNPKYRRNNWVADPDGFRTFKRDEFRDVIASSTPPYVIYVTRSYKKHGFLNGMYAINWHCEPVKLQRVSVIFENRVLSFPLRQFDEFSHHLRKVMPLVGKKRLMAWDIAPHHVEKIMEKGLMTSYLYLRERRKTELYEFALHVLRRSG